MQDKIHQFVKGRNACKGNVGVLLGVRYNDGIVVITGSKANFSHGDRFNKEEGLAMAEDRQIAVRHGRCNLIAMSMKDDLEIFVDRCKRYFRTDLIVIPALSVGKKKMKKVEKSACNV